jgi:hypothetical protein
MARRNLTIQLDESVVRSAKVLAAKRGMSVSGLVATELADLVTADERYDRGWRQAQEELADARPRGGRRWQRDELHAR